MSRSAIEWTDETWNPVVGCSKVSPGCDHCYAIDVAHRAMQPAHEGLTIRRPGERPDWSGVVRCLPERLEQPLRWRQPRRIFVNSMSDLFHPDVPSRFIAEVFAVMALAPHHTFQVLTKRPQRMADHFADDRFRSMVLDRIGNRTTDEVDPPWPLPNVWLGVSIESQRYAWRARHLLDTPAAVRFISAEPLLGPLNLAGFLPCACNDNLGCYVTGVCQHPGPGIDWLIVGGESGTGHRSIDPEWVRSLRDQATAAGVAFLFKQWGGRTPKAGGRELDGRTWDEYPAKAVPA